MSWFSIQIKYVYYLVQHPNIQMEIHTLCRLVSLLLFTELAFMMRNYFFSPMISVYIQAHNGSQFILAKEKENIFMPKLFWYVTLWWNISKWSDMKSTTYNVWLHQNALRTLSDLLSKLFFMYPSICTSKNSYYNF